MILHATCAAVLGAWLSAAITDSRAFCAAATG